MSLLEEMQTALFLTGLGTMIAAVSLLLREYSTAFLSVLAVILLLLLLIRTEIRKRQRLEAKLARE